MTDITVAAAEITAMGKWEVYRYDDWATADGKALSSLVQHLDALFPSTMRFIFRLFVSTTTTAPCRGICRGSSGFGLGVGDG
jgi:hypothetical protein